MLSPFHHVQLPNNITDKYLALKFSLEIPLVDMQEVLQVYHQFCQVCPGQSGHKIKFKKKSQNRGSQ
jgi:hypothetical protein